MDAKLRVWEDFQAYLEAKVFPHMAGVRIDKRQTGFGRTPDGEGRSTQHVAMRYASQFADHLRDPLRPVTAPDIRGRRRPWTLRYDLTFVPQAERPPTVRQTVLANPDVLEFDDIAVGTWECVDFVHIAIGKILNLEGFDQGRKPSGNKEGAPPVSVMRHVQDLFEMGALLTAPTTAPIISGELSAATLSNLGEAFARWRTDPEKEACFAAYSKLMRPHVDPSMVPRFGPALRLLAGMVDTWTAYRDASDGRDTADRREPRRPFKSF